MTAFGKILIANRGEIACRVARTAHALGYRTVAVYSDADADALHVAAAHEAVRLGPAEAAQSYLNVAAILDAAQRTGADAVHPGYGFLSERADFAAACADAGLVFIGPPPAAIDAMGNKAAAKRLMMAAGVPCVPGYQGADQSDAALIAAAAEVGFPIMVKAAAGGGGRGMRLVERAEDLPQALTTARSEAENAFGSGELILERAVPAPRHVEVQVFGDRHGNAVHLGERDCSVQRRHQKVIEEAPSPAVDAALRAKMGAAAVAAAKAIDYVGAGTVEFLLDADKNFYFLEMNTRLQVEHPVTERVTGQDLVAWQLRVAAGEPLPLAQDDIALDGHAIEVRLYAEDPAAGFLPAAGRIAHWAPGAGPGIRVDHGVRSGQDVSPHYDPMLAKVIAHGPDRDIARRRLIGALADTALVGVANNKAFLMAALADPVFADGAATTAFIADRFPAAALADPVPEVDLLALAAVLITQERGVRGGHGPLTYWHSGATARAVYALVSGETTAEVEVRLAADGAARVRVGDAEMALHLLARDGAAVTVEVDGRRRSVRAHPDGRDAVWIERDGHVHHVADTLMAPPDTGGGAGGGTIAAPMHGMIQSVAVEPGQTVAAGDVLLVLEAMKMQHEMRAPADGTVETLAVAVGDQVAAKAVLVVLDLAEDGA